jgi:hypothetical protein
MGWRVLTAWILLVAVGVHAVITMRAGVKERRPAGGRSLCHTVQRGVLVRVSRIHARAVAEQRPPPRPPVPAPPLCSQSCAAAASSVASIRGC